MGRRSLRGVLPEPFAAWMREALADEPPEEPAATCEDCVMCRAPAPRVSEAPLLFDPSVKCCSYLPELPNFLVGAILADGSSEAAPGRRSVRARIAAGEGVTPLGLFQTRAFRERYRPDCPGFGRDASLRCPHFLTDSGRCSIWRHREASCSTWSCKHERGAVGRAFRQALHALLKQVEQGVAAWCVQGGLGETGAAGKGGGSWGAFDGRPEAFYLECARRSDRLSWGEVREIGGAPVADALAACRAALARLRDPGVPERLSPGEYRVVGSGDAVVRIAAYAPFDPLDVPQPIALLLRHFDGRPTAVVLREIESQRGLRLSQDVLRPLVDFGILVAT